MDTASLWLDEFWWRTITMSSRSPNAAAAPHDLNRDKSPGEDSVDRNLNDTAAAPAVPGNDIA
jgi:hypothetical protein